MQRIKHQSPKLNDYDYMSIYFYYRFGSIANFYSHLNLKLLFIIMLKSKQYSGTRPELVRKPSLPTKNVSSYSSVSNFSYVSDRGVGRKSMPLLEAKNNQKE